MFMCCSVQRAHEGSLTRGWRYVGASRDGADVVVVADACAVASAGPWKSLHDSCSANGENIAYRTPAGYRGWPDPTLGA
jgi:hypothetical protein